MCIVVLYMIPKLIFILRLTENRLEKEKKEDKNDERMRINLKFIFVC